MRYGGSVEIQDVTAITPDIYVGATGKFTGHRLSDNVLTEVEGTITAIREAHWALLTIQTADGISRIRVM